MPVNLSIEIHCWGPDEITIVITQSGETADTTSAQREAKTRGSHTIAISMLSARPSRVKPMA